MWRAKAAGSIGGAALRVWRRTVRLERLTQPPLDRDVPAIYAVWHGRMIGPIFDFAGSGVASMASRSADGEIAARMATALGIRIARGSTSRGGRRALEEIAGWLQERSSRQAGLTVDGPRGPARRVKAGVVDLARRFRLPLVPVSFSARPHHLLRSWDRMMVPAPFSRVVVGYGPPVDLPFDAPTSAWQEATAVALDRTTGACDLHVHGRPLWPPREAGPAAIDR